MRTKIHPLSFSENIHHLNIIDTNVRNDQNDAASRKPKLVVVSDCDWRNVSYSANPSERKGRKLSIVFKAREVSGLGTVLRGNDHVCQITLKQPEVRR